MKSKAKDFDNAARKLGANIEIKNARAQYAKLKQYAAARVIELRGAIWRDMHPDTRKLVIKYDIDDALRRIDRAIKLDSARPRDISLLKFAASPDLDHIGGEFSTYNKILFDMKRAGAAPLSIKHAAVADMQNRRNVAAQYAETIVKIVQANKKLVRDAIAAGMGPDLSAWQELLRKVKNDLRKKMKIKDNVSVFVTDSWDDIAAKLNDSVDNLENTYAITVFTELLTPPHYIFINRDKIYNGMKGDNFNLFVQMMVSFAHEFGHFVDDVAPNKGALGAQKQNISEMLYTLVEQAGEKEYNANPTEASSREIEFHIANALTGRRDITD